MRKTSMTILLITGLIVPAFAGTIYYVDDDAAILGDGLTWITAFNDLQSALNIAQLGDEIRVAGGIYIPSELLDSMDPLSATFQLVDGVALRGGYAGEGANPDARDFAAYETVLTGDLDGTNQAYHVVYTSACQAGTILDGVTVTESGGEAMYNDPLNAATVAAISHCTFRDNAGTAIAYGELAITDCTFTGNHTPFFGGALLDVSGTLNGCTFQGNSADGFGGAIFLSFFLNLTVTNCSFTANAASQSGGAIEGFSSSMSLTNCSFSENAAVVSGGAIRSLSCTQSLMGCAFVANSAPTGGAVFSGDISTQDFINCTLAGNTAASGSAIACDSVGQPSTLTITNCILWDGGAEIWNNDSSAITVAYSDIQGGWAGTGNIDAPPLFVRPPSGTDLGDLHLTVGSPCVDAGNTAALPGSFLLDLDETSRVKGPAVDMGVFELAEVIPADVDMFPRILYKKSFLRWLTVFIGLPTEHNVASIDVDTIAITTIENLCCPDCPPIVTNLPRDPAFTPRILDCDWDGIPELVVKFNRQDLLDLLEPGFYRITVSGMLLTAEPFQGFETICVIGH